MKNIPENDVLEQRIRKMAENIQPPASLSAENLLRKLPPRQRISIVRKYTPAMALAACLLIVLSGTAVMRNFTGAPLVQPESGQSYSDSPVSSEEHMESQPEESSALQDQESESSSSQSSNSEASSKISNENSNSAVSEQPIENEPESATDDPPVVDSRENLPEESAPDSPPDALNLNYPGLQPHENLENYQDVYEALSSLRQQSIMQSNAAPIALFSAKSAISSAVLEKVIEGSTMQVNGSTLYALSNDHDSIAIYQTKGSETKFITKFTPEAVLPEINGMHLGYSYITQIIATDDSLLVISNATYWSDSTAQQKIITVVSCYSTKNPLAPVYLNTLCQEGELSAAYVNDGILAIITKYKLPGNSTLDSSQPVSFLPAAYENGRILLPRRNQVEISKDAGSTVYTTIGSVNLSKTSEFADLLCYLSDTTSVYADDQIICLARNNAAQNTVLLSAFSVKFGTITLTDEQSFSGTLFGDITANTAKRYLRLVTKNSDGTVSVRVLDKKLHEIGKLENYSAANPVSVQYINDMICFFDPQSKLCGMINCVRPQSPSPISLQTTSYNQPVSMVGFDTLLLDMREEYSAETNTTGIRFSMYDAPSDGNFKQLHTLLISGNTVSDALYDQNQIFIDGRQGLLGFGITRTKQTESGTVRSTSYLLYQYDIDEGFTLLCELPTSSDGDTSLPEYQIGVRSNNLFYVITPTSIYTIDLSTGKTISQAAVY